MQHFKPTCAIALGEVTAFVPEAKLYQRTRRGQRLSPAIMADLTVIAVANDQGFADIAATVLRGMEARLSVTEHDRVAALAGEGMTEFAFVPLADAGERLHRLREALTERAARPKPLALVQAKARRKTAEEQQHRAAYLERLLADAVTAVDRAQTPKQRESAFEGRMRLVEDIERHRNEQWMTDAMGEAAQLEARRGGEIVTEQVTIETPVIRDNAYVWRKGRQVTRREKVTRPRVTNRDGLDSLATSHLDANGDIRRYPDGSPMAPAIDAIQHAAGLLYRDHYEKAVMDGRIKSLLAEPTGSGQPVAMTVEEIFDIDNVRRQLARAKRGVAVFDVEKRVRDQVHAEHGEAMGMLAVGVLRAIAGAGATLYSLAPSGRAKQRYSLAIKEALTAAADHYGLH